jgi:hypothetical protein
MASAPSRRALGQPGVVMYVIGQVREDMLCALRKQIVACFNHKVQLPQAFDIHTQVEPWTEASKQTAVRGCHDGTCHQTSSQQHTQA